VKLTIKGRPSAQDLAKALSETLNTLGIDLNDHELRGATVYFNLYDRETGYQAQPMFNGDEVDDVLWLPGDMPDKQRQSLANRAPANALVIFSRREPQRPALVDLAVVDVEGINVA